MASTSCSPVRRSSVPAPLPAGLLAREPARAGTITSKRAPPARHPEPARRPATRNVNISELFIRRPVATSLLMAGVVIMGMLGYFMLPISALPAVDFPTIQVTAQYPGASPDVMASSVTTPLERQFGQISGLSR